MTIVQTRYTPGRFGLGTEFAQSEIPIEYASNLVNRFINIHGAAEKRQGLGQIGNTISGGPTITGLHEYVDRNGNSVLFASSGGNIYRYNTSTLNWDQVLSGKSESVRLGSAQMGNRLCFFNGVDRNFFTEDGGDSFGELKALINRGQASTSATNATNLTDSNIGNWLTESDATNNDLVFNSTLSAFGIITSAGISQVQHTAIGSAATGLGLASRNQQASDFYQIVDLVELNIIPQNDGLDNFGVAGSGTSTNQIRVSGVDFSETEILSGDFVYNTTRSAITRVESVSANLTVKTIAAQTTNDSLQFFKSAMPVASWMHVHYGRAYYIDARSRGNVRISGPDDPQDMTTFAQTLQAGSLSYENRQPQAENLLSLKTFQRYLIAAGEHNVYADSGVDPVQDTTAAATDFRPVGLFPQGAISPEGMDSIGGTMIIASPDGIRNFAATFDSEAFQTANVSEAVKSEIANAINANREISGAVQVVHYPRRNWALCKVGNLIYNYNYTPYFLAGQIQSNPFGSWSKFTGLFAQMETFLVLRNGDLICAGPGGKVYEFDKGSYSDDGNPIETVYETGYLNLIEPSQGTQYKTGNYIKPKFEAGAPITYTIGAVGDYNTLTESSITFTTPGVGQVGFAQVGVSPVGGARINEPKLPLRWKGEQFKIRVTTNSANGPDIITSFTVYGNILGKQ